MSSHGAANFDGGRLFFSALRVWKDNFVLLTGLAFLINLGIAAVSGLMLVLTGLNLSILDYILGPLIAGVLMLVAADILAGQRVDLQAHISRVIQVFGPLVILSLAVAFLVVIGLMALIVPGLYATAVFIAVTPLILFENAGWDALRRSHQMTKPFVWPIAGVILRLGVLMFLVILPLILITTDTSGETPGAQIQLVPGLEILSAGVIILFSSALSTLSILIGLMIYHRLRDLSGGVSEVFE
ncbi:MAG: hypothetical protein AAGE38_09345 [Pseudomonadota bacterium]